MARRMMGLIDPSNEAPEGSRVLYADFDNYLDMFYIPDEVYSTVNGKDLHIQLVYPSCPMNLMGRQMQKVGRPGLPDAGVADKKFPVIIYCQGSGYMNQDVYKFLPKLSWLAAKGYLVASVEYRCTPDAPFPAAVQDLKAAIRFLRSKADYYGIEKDRIGIWGDSSGGYMSLMAAATGWTDEFDDDRYPGESSAVSACVDFYGPADLGHMHLYPRASVFETKDASKIAECQFLNRDLVADPESGNYGSPVYFIHEDKEYPPFLIFHGDRDGTVPFNQSVRMYERLRACGKNADFVRVKGAGHGTGMWTQPVLDMIANFFSANV